MAELAGQIFGFVTILGVFVLAAAYIVTSVRRGSNEASKEINSTLKELLDVQDKKISALEKHVSNLEGRVEELSRKNGDLQEIIEKALNEYFLAHPEAVIKLTELKGMRKNDYGE